MTTSSSLSTSNMVTSATSEASSTVVGTWTSDEEQLSAEMTTAVTAKSSHSLVPQLSTETVLSQSVQTPSEAGVLQSNDGVLGNVAWCIVLTALMVGVVVTSS